MNTNKYEIEAFGKNAKLVEGNAFVWNTNGNAPFDDMLAVWENAGFITPEQRANTNALREEQTNAFFAEYKTRSHKLSGEELFEARAAFGEGAVVVDVITGERTQL